MPLSQECNKSFHDWHQRSVYYVVALSSISASLRAGDMLYIYIYMHMYVHVPRICYRFDIRFMHAGPIDRYRQKAVVVLLKLPSFAKQPVRDECNDCEFRFSLLAWSRAHH